MICPKTPLDYFLFVGASEIDVPRMGIQFRQDSMVELFDSATVVIARYI